VSAPAIYCPMCNAAGQAQPVLTAMTWTAPAVRGGLHVARCLRCGYEERYSGSTLEDIVRLEREKKGREWGAES
jgi:hypothetical protein